MKLSPKTCATAGLVALLTGCGTVQYNPQAWENPSKIVHGTLGELTGNRKWIDYGNSNGVQQEQASESSDSSEQSTYRAPTDSPKGYKWCPHNEDSVWGNQLFAICNTFVDKNGNGRVDAPQEFEGIEKDLFWGDKDKVLIYSFFFGGAKDMEYSLVNMTTGKVQYKKEIPNGQKKIVDEFQPGELESGQYRANWVYTKTGQTLQTMQFTVAR